MNLAVLMACAICGYGLTESRDGEKVTYQHPVSESDRHRPVPVPAGLVNNLFHRCHICSGPPPVWNYQTAEIEAEAFGGTSPGLSVGRAGPGIQECESASWSGTM